MNTAAQTILQLQDHQNQLLRERDALLLKVAELESDNEWLRQDRSQALRLINRSLRKGASHSFCRHLLARIEQTLSETRRAA